MMVGFPFPIAATCILAWQIVGSYWLLMEERVQGERGPKEIWRPINCCALGKKPFLWSPVSFLLLSIEKFYYKTRKLLSWMWKECH